MKILVTGGAGFIGSHTVEQMLAKGHQVTVLDDFSSGKKENLPVDPNLATIEGDIRDRDLLRSAVDDKDAVLHLAAQVSVPLSMDDPAASGERNVMGFINVLDSAYRAGVRRFVYASSAAVYGVPHTLPLDEDSPVDAISPYGLEKSIDEQYAELYLKLHGFPALGLRYFNVYGPRQDAASPYAGVISKFVSALQAGRPLIVLGDGNQTRDFIFVEDIAKINALAVTGSQAGICNIASGKSVTLLEMVSALAQASGCAPLIEFKPAAVGDIRHSSVNQRRQRELFGEMDVVPLATGLRKLWEAHRRLSGAAI